MALLDSMPGYTLLTRFFLLQTCGFNHERRFMIDVLKQGAVDGGKVSKSYVPETCPALADLTLKPVSWALGN